MFKSKYGNSTVLATIDDWKKGIQKVDYWWGFGLLDVLLRYRRTFLGPIWITLTFAITASGLGFVYSTLFKVEAGSYIAYLISGLATWMYVSGMINDGCTVLTRTSGIVKEENIPIFAHTLRSVTSSLVVFCHNGVVIVIGAFIFSDNVSLVMLLALLGLILVTLNGIWLTMLLGLVCARYRDLSPLITTLVSLMFLVTPVFWYRDMLGGRAVIADSNPFFHLIEVVRAPLLGSIPATSSYIFCVVSLFVGFTLALIASHNLRHKIPFWV